jgi:hypothetical protein
MMDRQRVIKIIEAYGGHAAMWPAAERAEAEALARGDAGLAERIEEAKAVDVLLRDWACALVPTTAAEADAAAERALVDVRRPVRRRWVGGAMTGGVLAASLALGAVLLPGSPFETSSEQTAAVDPTSEQALAANDMLVWGTVFTPTPQEEIVL